MKYETMTCDEKAISKVIRWGMILKIRMQHRKQGRDSNRQDRPRTPVIIQTPHKPWNTPRISIM
jgi:hypothetical protein